MERSLIIWRTVFKIKGINSAGSNLNWPSSYLTYIITNSFFSLTYKMSYKFATATYLCSNESICLFPNAGFILQQWQIELYRCQFEFITSESIKQC